MRNIALSSLILVCATALGPAPPRAHAQPPESREVVVVLTGVQAARGGTLRCSIFASERGFPTEARHAMATVVARGSGARRTCTFRVPGPGPYAVSVGHDENDDREVNRNVFGAPTEGWGTTRNVTHTFRAPSFDESRFEVTAARWRIVVRMHY